MLHSYSILRPAVEKEILPFCQEKGIGIVAYSPLTSGLLSGNYTYETKFSDDDWRSRNVAHIGEGLRKNVDRVVKLKAIASRYGITIPQLAIAYDLAHPALTSAIVGVRKPSHIMSVLHAIDVSLNEATLTEIRKIAVE